MEQKHNRDDIYPKEKTFTRDELLSLTAHDVYMYLAMRAYVKPDPSPKDNPKLQRYETIKYGQKAISYFMPSSSPWNEEQQSGNPTMDKYVNDLCNELKRSKK